MYGLQFEPNAVNRKTHQINYKADCDCGQARELQNRLICFQLEFDKFFLFLSFIRSIFSSQTQYRNYFDA